MLIAMMDSAEPFLRQLVPEIVQHDPELISSANQLAATIQQHLVVIRDVLEKASAQEINK